MGDAPFPLKSALKLSTPVEKRQLRPISAHNVSTVRDSGKSSITTNIKSTTGFPTSHRWSAYVTPKCPKGWLKERVFRFLSKSQRLIVRLKRRLPALFEFLHVDITRQSHGLFALAKHLSVVVSLNFKRTIAYKHGCSTFLHSGHSSSRHNVRTESI